MLPIKCAIVFLLQILVFVPIFAALPKKGKPLFIEYFYSHSFLPDALKIDYDVYDNTQIFYNITAFRPFPGRLLMNFFVRQYASEKSMPSTDVYKRRNVDFCKTLDVLHNMTNDVQTKPFLLQDTFVTSCPLVNGFYYVQGGIIPSNVIPAFMARGRYVASFELIQVIDELVKLMNLRFVIVLDENVHGNSDDDADASENEKENESESENSNEEPTQTAKGPSNDKSNETRDNQSNENENKKSDEKSNETVDKNSEERSNDKSDGQSNEKKDTNSNENPDNDNTNDNSHETTSDNANENTKEDTEDNINENEDMSSN